MGGHSFRPALTVQRSLSTHSPEWVDKHHAPRPHAAGASRDETISFTAEVALPHPWLTTAQVGLVRITNGSYDRNLVVASHLHNLLFGPESPAPLDYSWTYFIKVAREVHRSKVLVLDYHAHSHVLAQLKGVGILPAKATSATLMSITTMIRALSRLGIKEDAIDGIAEAMRAASPPPFPTRRDNKQQQQQEQQQQQLLQDEGQQEGGPTSTSSTTSSSSSSSSSSEGGRTTQGNSTSSMPDPTTAQEGVGGAPQATAAAEPPSQPMAKRARRHGPVQVGAAFHKQGGPINNNSQQQQHTPRHLPIGQDFPAKLPPIPQLTPQQMASSYGLTNNTLAGLAHLQLQIHAFHAWCTDGVRMDRDIRYTAVQQDTWDATHKVLTGYMGYCLKFRGMAGTDLSLDLFGDPMVYSHYISFHVARGVGCPYLRKTLSHSRKVVAWLASTRPHLKEHFTRVEHWLEVLSRQAPFAAPSNRRAYNLPSAKDILLFQAGVEGLATSMWEDWLLHSDPSQPVTMPMMHAKVCMDAALLGLMFGYVPPVRLACIRTCIHPSHVGGPCLDTDCATPHTCKGNRLEWIGDKPLLADLSEPPNPTLRAVFPHHKNARKWNGYVISFELPPALCCMLHPYLLHGHDTLLAHTPSSHKHGEDATHTLLFTNTQGRELTEVNLCHWFSRMLVDHKAPFPNFPPSKLRHVFVDERQSDMAAPGPSNRSAARIMGNSERVWATHYDHHLPQREVDGAVQAMAQWREALLEEGQAQGQGQA